jgi:tetratricopeptide (TPR) repeat protein
MEEGFDFLSMELLNAELAVSRLSLASIHAAEGKLDAAIVEYTKVLEYDPDLYLCYFNRGRLFFRKGDRDKAMGDFSRAIMLEPGVAVTYICRGDIHFEQGNLAAAREDYNKALELSPANKAVIQRMERLQKKAREDQRPG